MILLADNPLIRQCECVDWSGPSLSAYTQRHVFAWRGPFIWYLNFQTTIFLGSPKFYWCKYRNTGASIKFISPSTIFCHGYDYIHVIVICYLGPILWTWMLREKQKKWTYLHLNALCPWSFLSVKNMEKQRIDNTFAAYNLFAFLSFVTRRVK